MEPDATSGMWIVDNIRNIRGFNYTVTSLVPPVFAAYARVFHPAETLDGEAVRWADVAAANGTTAHSAMEWGSIVGSWDAPGQPGVWSEGPSLGSLPALTARSLAGVLQTFTQTPDKCHFGYWEGAGYIDVPEHHPCLPMLGRNMVLFSGGIAHADIQFGETPRFPVGVSAHLWWPEDRAWCVATDTDLMTTYVGGSEDCIAAVLGSDHLEALAAGADQKVTWDSDTVNPLPPRP